jgi:hypothetical protein
VKLIRLVSVSALLVGLAGCSSAPSTHATAVERTGSVTPIVTAKATAPPEIITALTDQKLVYDCPRCGMEFAGPGQCTMCHVDLVAMKVDYICPADGGAVQKAGSCPRCQANARVVKTALAVAVPPALGGN